LNHVFHDFNSSNTGLSQRIANNLFADTVDFQVKLNAGNTILRTGDFKVHVAIMIFITLDIS
jgi:hypothetical protein